MHIRPEVRLIDGPAALKDGFGRGLKNELDHPLNYLGGQHLRPWPCRSKSEVLDRAAGHEVRTVRREC